MSVLTLKIIAIVTMIMDHIGAITGEHWLRIVGRLSLPIFAFLIANGFKHTSNVKKYLLRLFAFAVISEIPFDLFIENKLSIIEFNGLIPDVRLDNVLFTFTIGLLYLSVSDYFKKKEYKCFNLINAALLFVSCCLAAFVSSDYGAAGILWVALFGTFDVQKKESAAPLALGSIVLASWHVITKNFARGILQLTGISINKIPILVYFFCGSKVTASDRLQMISAFAVALILLYNGKSGMPKSKVANRTLRYVFYAFYPIHLLILYYLAYYIL